MGFQIALDGPAGAGKSTIAKKAAALLQYIYVDTGAMYRAIALYLLRQGIAPEDREQIAARCKEAHVTLSYVNGEQVVLLNGENVNGLIRTDEVSNMASKSSAVPEVRALLLMLQRNLAEENNVLMDGRDIGTTVLPNAQVKIFLTASPRVRALRRFDDLKASEPELTLEEVERRIIQRDYDDSHREISPLKQAEDAILLDTSEMNVEESVAAVLAICREKAGQE